MGSNNKKSYLSILLDSDEVIGPVNCVVFEIAALIAAERLFCSEPISRPTNCLLLISGSIY